MAWTKAEGHVFVELNYRSSVFWNAAIPLNPALCIYLRPQLTAVKRRQPIAAALRGGSGRS